MTPAEAAVLIGIAASFDNRKPDEAAATAWSMALEGLRFEDCRDVIVAHYRASTDWIMPAHVVDGVKRLRSRRLMEHPPLNPPPELDPADTAGYSRWLTVTRKAIADGAPIPDVAYAATRELGDLRAVVKTLPPTRAKPSERTAEHNARKEAARAELGPPVPIPSEPMRESETGEAVE